MFHPQAGDWERILGPPYAAHSGPCPTSLPAPFPGPRTCKELLSRGYFLSGWHTIYLPDCRPLSVLCDMEVDGGGWTVSVGMGSLYKSEQPGIPGNGFSGWQGL